MLSLVSLLSLNFKSSKHAKMSAFMTASGGSTVAEQSNTDPEVKGSSPRANVI
jgi:hypothetical protein